MMDWSLARDIAIVFLALVSIALGMVVIVATLLLVVWTRRFLSVAEGRLEQLGTSAEKIMGSAQDVAQSASQTASQVHGTASFLSDTIVMQAIRIASAVSGATRFASTVVRPPGGDQKGE